MTRAEREAALRYGRDCLALADQLSDQPSSQHRAIAQALVGIGTILAVFVDHQDGTA